MMTLEKTKLCEKYFPFGKDSKKITFLISNNLLDYYKNNIKEESTFKKYKNILFTQLDLIIREFQKESIKYSNKENNLSEDQVNNFYYFFTSLVNSIKLILSKNYFCSNKYLEENIPLVGSNYTYNSFLFDCTNVKSYKSSNFINFLYDIKLEKQKSGKNSVVISGVSLRKLDGAIRRLCIEKGVFSKEKYEKTLKIANTNSILPLSFLKPDDLEQVTLTKLVSFILGDKQKYFQNTIAILNRTIIIILSSIQPTNFFKEENSEFKNISLIKGEAITYFYDKKNYIKKDEGRSSVLHNSCMRYGYCIPKINFYSENSDSVELLVLYDKEDTKKIRARALVWTAITGQKLIDRIYFSTSKDHETLLTYSIIHNFIPIYNTLLDFNDSFKLKDNIQDYIIKISPEFENNFPYFDSLRSIDILNGYASFSSYLLGVYCMQNKKTALILPPSKSISLDREFDYLKRTRYDRSYNKNIIETFLSKIKTSTKKEKKELTKNFWEKLFSYPVQFYIKGKPVHTDYHNKTNKLNQILEDNFNKRLFNYTFIDNKIYPKKDLIRFCDSKKYMLHRTFTKLQKNHNFARKCLYIDEGKKKTGLADKNSVVWSNSFKAFLLKRDAIYLNFLKDWCLKDKANIQKALLIKKNHIIKKLFVNKVVHITKEGNKKLKEIYKDILDKRLGIKLSMFRPSRKFYIKPENIQGEYIKIKDFNINIKYLQRINNENGKQNRSN